MGETLVKPGEEGWGPEIPAAVILAGIVYLTTDIGLLVAALGTLGLLMVYGGVRSIRQLLATRSAERTSIGSLRGDAGAVEVDGTARPAEDPVTAPMTGSESIAYRVQVLRWEPSREDS